MPNQYNPKEPTSQTTTTSTATTDPTSLKRSVKSFLDSNFHTNGDRQLWDLLEHYPSTQQPLQQSEQNQQPRLNGADHKGIFYYEHDILSSELVCGAGPGRGMEQDAGYKLLVEKMRVLQPSEKQSTRFHTNASQHTRKPRLLCMVYTYSKMRHLVRSQALIWGKDCDGFLAFSNETLPSLGIYQLPLVDYSNGPPYQDSPAWLGAQPPTEEAYQNLWQKVRHMWKHVHDHHLGDYDYFYISGDDVYLIVDNLRAYLEDLSALESRSNSMEVTPRFFGSYLPTRSVLAGGPGYVLNRAVLKRYVGLNRNGNLTSASIWSHCLAGLNKASEDLHISYCIQQFLKIKGNDTDTRNSRGEQRFHNTDPASLYLMRATASKRGSYNERMAKGWELQSLPLMDLGKNLPNNVNANTDANASTVGPKHELDAVAAYSFSLHRIYTPTYMARIHAILHPKLCPIDSPLGKGLMQHYDFYRHDE